MSTTRLTEEVSATSQTSPEEAIARATSAATARFDGVEGANVERAEVVIRGGNVVGYRVTLTIDHVGRSDVPPEPFGPASGKRTALDPRELPRPSARGLLRTDEHGVARVGRTRVSLDSLIGAFRMDRSPEEIAESYPSVKVADVYRILGYYLEHQEAVDEYLAQREEEAESLRERVETDFDPRGLKERLLARRRGA